MALCARFLLQLGHVLVLPLAILASGANCGRRWSLQPLVTGGFGCVRSVVGVYSARRCLLRGHHLAMASSRERNVELVCIKDEIYVQTLSSPSTMQINDFMTTSAANVADVAENNQPSKSDEDLKENSNNITPENNLENFTSNTISTVTVNVNETVTPLQTETLNSTAVPTTNIQRNEGDTKLELKDTKLQPDLIEVNEKEKLTKSMLCCNPALGSG
ncbi:uncharacterized protein LOC125658974 [Ostrea edulis]|uniref:uncharacterized protein LOC125658974 n=1 Tax=Ostrea edulis TaxID=37623 RepID=UPI0024AFA31C|nr:uncharacterized protein LOC125658974 [Ostrea edulis]